MGDSTEQSHCLGVAEEIKRIPDNKPGGTGDMARIIERERAAARAESDADARRDADEWHGELSKASDRILTLNSAAKRLIGAWDDGLRGVALDESIGRLRTALDTRPVAVPSRPATHGKFRTFEAMTGSGNLRGMVTINRDHIIGASKDGTEKTMVTIVGQSAPLFVLAKHDDVRAWLEAAE